MSAARRQVATDLWTKPIGLNHKPAYRMPLNYTHHRHFIITQPESWYSFYHPTEGRRLSRPGWLATYRDGLPARIERWARKLLKGLKMKTYEERLMVLGIYPLHQRRLRGDLGVIEVYKIVTAWQGRIASCYPRWLQKYTTSGNILWKFMFQDVPRSSGKHCWVSESVIVHVVNVLAFVVNLFSFATGSGF